MVNLFRCAFVAIALAGCVVSGNLDAQVSSDVFSPTSSVVYNKKVPFHIAGKPNTLVFIFIYEIRKGKKYGPPKQLVGRLGPSGVLKTTASFPEGEFEIDFDFKYPIKKTITRRFEVDHFNPNGGIIPGPAHGGTRRSSDGGQRSGSELNVGQTTPGLATDTVNESLWQLVAHDETELALLNFFGSADESGIHPTIMELEGYGMSILIPLECVEGQAVEIHAEMDIP